MSYVDGFVVPVERTRLEEYRQFSETAAKRWMELGATAYVECVGDDVPQGVRTSFPRAVELNEGEVVVFAWITYPSKAVRDQVSAAIMADPAFRDALPPFDGKRLIWGGFTPFVEHGKGA